MKKIILFSLFLSSIVYSQLLEENFDYTADQNLTSNGWTAFSSSGTNPITVNNGGLVYTDYVNSDIGNAALLDNDGEDVRKTFSSAVSSGSIYVSFLVNVTTNHSTISEEYVLHLRSGTTAFARFWIDYENPNIAFGLSQTKSTSAHVKTSFNYARNTTYLIILKYSFVSGTLNDEVSMWIKSSGVPDSEVNAGSPDLGPITTTDESGSTSDPSDIDNIALRQSNPNQNVIIDGIRVATSWSQAPLPVELTSFTATVNDNLVTLNWSTATEVNNYGFNVERTAVETGHDPSLQWETICFVQGHGNCHSSKEYTFTDSPTGGKEFYYRLKQIDFDGSYQYSEIVSVCMENIYQLKLEQNYPNPFNPHTTIKYTIPPLQPDVSSREGNQRGVFVTLKVYNILGELVTTLVKGQLDAGIYEVEFNGSKLTSGIYYLVLQSGDFIEIKKCLLIK